MGLWNYLRPLSEAAAPGLSITYYMNRLQGLSARAHYLVSLNRSERIKDASVIYQTTTSIRFTTPSAVASQPGLRALQGTRRTTIAAAICATASRRCGFFRA